MPIPMLQALNPQTQAVFDHLTENLAAGHSRKFDHAHGLFMALCVERLTERHYSLAHYYEQNGDLMADPEMTFFKSADGQVYPCSFQQDNLGIYRASLDITDEGVIEAENAREQSSQADFADLWMRNIADQQGLPFQFPEEDDR